MERGNPKQQRARAPARKRERTPNLTIMGIFTDRVRSDVRTRSREQFS